MSVWRVLSTALWSSYNGVYTLEGCAMASVNGAIFVALLRRPALRKRKEYVVIGALALADAICGSGLALIGGHGALQSYRIQVGSLAPSHTYTPWTCMSTMAHPLVYIVGSVLSSLMLLCVSLDRLHAVCAPVSYFKRDRAYAYTLCGAFYAVGALIAICAAAGSYVYTSAHADYGVRYTCGLHNAMGAAWAQQTYHLAVFWPAAASVAVYALIPLAYRVHTAKRWQANNESARLEQLRRQRRLNTTLGILSACTMLLYVVPSMMKAKLFGFPIMSIRMWGMTGPQLMNIVINTNTLTNVTMYCARHEALRAALFALFGIKRKPQSVAAVANAAPLFASSRANAASNQNQQPQRWALSVGIGHNAPAAGTSAAGEHRF